MTWIKARAVRRKRYVDVETSFLIVCRVDEESRLDVVGDVMRQALVGFTLSDWARAVQVGSTPGLSGLRRGIVGSDSWTTLFVVQSPGTKAFCHSDLHPAARLTRLLALNLARLVDLVQRGGGIGVGWKASEPLQD